MSSAALPALLCRPLVLPLPALAEDRQWGLVLGLLVVAAVLVVAGLVVLVAGRRGR